MIDALLVAVITLSLLLGSSSLTPFNFTILLAVSPVSNVKLKFSLVSDFSFPEEVFLATEFK